VSVTATRLTFCWLTALSLVSCRIVEAERLLPLTRVSMSRVPSGGNLISVVIGAYSTLRILEMLEISRNVFGDNESRHAMYRAFRNCPLEILAIKIAGGNTSDGVLDDVLEVSRILSMSWS
jgi:hypothetical protein